MMLPKDWKNKVKLNYEYRNMKELAADLGVEFRPGYSDGMLLRRQLEKHFNVEFLPSPNGCRTSHRFVVTGRKDNVTTLERLTAEELEMLERFRAESKEK